MSRTPFEARWELSDAQREQVRTIKAALAQIENARAGLAAIEAGLHAQAHAIAREVLDAMPGTAPSAYQVPFRSMAADLATVQHVSDGVVRSRMDDAITLVEHFPAVFTALSESHVSAAHARAICDEGARLAEAGTRARYEQIVLSLVDTTPARLRRICQVVAERLLPEPIAERHEAAAAGRALWLAPADDGMAEIRLLVDAALAAGIEDRVASMARTVKAGTAGAAVDERTLPQIRADVAADLLLTAAPTGHGEGLDEIRATVHTVPAEVISGDDTRAAHLHGGGIVAPATARRLAGKTRTWARLFIDPRTGVPTAVDTYVPTAEQRRYLSARDEHCRFPGCRRPIRRCDIDHTVPYSEGGATDIGNMAALCRAHHVLKHHSPWRVSHLGDGVLEWTTPTGQILHDRPTPTVRFMATADSDPPPF
ncbi:HNH endonuclease signature motif containing protein [Microbacterium marinilacus]|nr:HNH endonuclease signature motif containing protein [Microbacterium marinilacus]MBY0687197.1 HNH endonuclease [Microbacterium marinilacus]